MTYLSTAQHDLESLLSSRYSCRGYTTQEVPDDDIARMFELAQKAPSWCNTQPWQVVATRGEATDRLAAALTEYVQNNTPDPDFQGPSQYTGVYDQRRKESGFALYESLSIARDDKASRHEQAIKNFSFFGAPHVAIITTDQKQGTYGAIDCGGYVNTLMLAAQSLGIATIAQASIAMYSPAVRQHFDLADDRLIVCAVSFGYADLEHPANSFRTTRAQLSDVLELRDT